jgi:hypothetical protein
VGRPLEVVDEDRPGDPDLVAQSRRRRELVLEGGVCGQVLARVRLARVEEVPAPVRMPPREIVEQRTLCSAVRSGEGAELEDEAAPPPEVGETNAVAAEDRQHAVRRTLAGVEGIREGAELPVVLTRLDIAVEVLVVVASRNGSLRAGLPSRPARQRSSTT